MRIDPNRVGLSIHTLAFGMARPPDPTTIPTISRALPPRRSVTSCGPRAAIPNHRRPRRAERAGQRTLQRGDDFSRGLCSPSRARSARHHPPTAPMPPADIWAFGAGSPDANNTRPRSALTAALGGSSDDERGRRPIVGEGRSGRSRRWPRVRLGELSARERRRALQLEVPVAIRWSPRTPRRARNPRLPEDWRGSVATPTTDTCARSTGRPS